MVNRIPNQRPQSPQAEPQTSSPTKVVPFVMEDGTPARIEYRPGTGDCCSVVVLPKEDGTPPLPGLPDYLKVAGVVLPVSKMLAESCENTLEKQGPPHCLPCLIAALELVKSLEHLMKPSDSAPGSNYKDN